MKVFKKLFLTVILVLIMAVSFVPFASKASEAAFAYDGQLQEYSGKIYHIFTHSLIVDTKLSFASKNSDGYNKWMTTRDEFIKALDLLYKHNFILVDIDSAVKKNADGTITKTTLMLPKGKKPLVLSVDDVNYYDYMKNEGFADRLTVDDKGRVTTIVIKDGKETLDYQGDVVPILDDFVAQNPGFAHNGAKGILALTGYQGVFGYRTTTLEGAQKDAATAEAKRVAEALKASGWKIACHSYTHTQRFRDGSITTERLQTELARWEAEIAPIVGKTHIFISPFGMHLKANEERMKILTDNNYHIYCPVDSKMNTTYAQNVMIQTRLNFDGFSMLKYPNRIKSNFFDPSLIIDKSRPAIEG